MTPNTPTTVTVALPWYGRVWQNITKSAQWSFKKIRPALPIMEKGLDTFGRICAAIGIIFLDVITEKKSGAEDVYLWDSEKDAGYLLWQEEMLKKRK